MRRLKCGAGRDDLDECGGRTGDPDHVPEPRVSAHPRGPGPHPGAAHHRLHRLPGTLPHLIPQILTQLLEIDLVHHEGREAEHQHDREREDKNPGLATLFGGAMAGIGGAFLSVFYTPLWVEGMVSGRGWIAIALVVFATWRPFRVLVGAYLFGGVMVAQLFVQGSGLEINIPSQFLSALPYLATIVVLVIISRDQNTVRLNAPVSLGQPFRPEA